MGWLVVLDDGRSPWSLARVADGAFRAPGIVDDLSSGPRRTIDHSITWRCPFVLVLPGDYHHGTEEKTTERKDPRLDGIADDLFEIISFVCIFSNSYGRLGSVHLDCKRSNRTAISLRSNGTQSSVHRSSYIGALSAFRTLDISTSGCAVFLALFFGDIRNRILVPSTRHLVMDSLEQLWGTSLRSNLTTARLPD